MQNKYKNIIYIVLLAFLFNAGGLQGFCQNDSGGDLSRIENEIWGLSYTNETDNQRIERIEKEVFGTTNSKMPNDKRIDKITDALGIESEKEASKSLGDLYIGQKPGEGVQYPQIDRIESELLGNVYKDENIYTRLERLEKKVFGAKQDGELAQRTEALKSHVSMNTTPKMASNRQGMPDMYNSYDNSYVDSDVELQISALENMMFQTSYANEPVKLRLNRLETRIFQRSYTDDDDMTRISRIQAAATAGKTAKYYDNNKFQKFTSTGIQAASIILMILALIL